jgi:endoglucanase
MSRGHVVLLALLTGAFVTGTMPPSTPGRSIPERAAGDIRLNQVGFYPAGPKVAVVLRAGTAGFLVTTPDLRDTVFAGALSSPSRPDYANRQVRIANFSGLGRTGTFVLHVPGTGSSHPFEVRPQVHARLARAAVKAFYFQRGSTELVPAYAGVWHRAAGHPDTAVLVHASAASPGRPAGARISAPLGWYDAGDYNKYVVNSGITTSTLLSLYEDFPGYALGGDIPESGNALPDLLDEILWNLRWMLAMQDPADGGVYHKLTNADFDDLATLPAAAGMVRYVVQKSTPATLDFAAVAAHAARVLRAFERDLPGLADSCLIAARRAWSWAERNPAVAYDQTRLNSHYDPDIVTGAYGDHDFDDERLWAAAELLVATGDIRYYRAVDWSIDAPAPVPSWRDVRTLGSYRMVRSAALLPAAARAAVPRIRASLLAAADSLLADTAEQPYQVVFGKRVDDIVWGSTAVAANQGILLVQAYRLTDAHEYLAAALGNLDYLLGRNATGYSFVTGYGARTPMHPHHRPSIADSVVAPVPGFLVGGPNINAPQQDRCTTYPSVVPDETYTDDACSYASNEIAINWNAAFAYLVAAIEALQFQAGLSPITPR